MTPWQQRQTPLIRRMAEDMLLRNLAQKTIDCYTYHIGRFAKFIGKPVEDATPEDVRSFHKGGSPLTRFELPLGASNPLTLFATLKTEN